MGDGKKIGDKATVLWWGPLVVVGSTYLPHLLTLSILAAAYFSLGGLMTATWAELIPYATTLAVIWVPWYRLIIMPLDEVREMGGSPAKPCSDMPPVFPNGWFRVAHSHQVRPKDVVEVAVLGQNMAVFRGEGGRAFVLDAYCTHLGANMAVGGEVKGDCLICPFHLWTYDGASGKCVDIPYMESKARGGEASGAAGCGIPAGAKVKTWEVLEQNGIIMVWYDAEGRPPSWQPPVIDGLATGQMLRQGTVLHHANAHIQDINENGVDSAHFNAVHSFPLAFGQKEFGWLVNIVWSKMEWVPQSGPGVEHRADSYVNYHVEICGVDITGSIQVKAELIGPAIGQIIYNSHFGRVVILVTTCPLGPLRQQGSFTVFTDRGIPSLIAKVAMWSFCAMFEQDVPIWNSKRYARTPMVVRGDGDIMAWRRWYRQFYSENSPTLRSLRDNMQW